MRATVLPALAACCEEGWMEPARAEDLPELDHPGSLHYLCYDAAKFDDLREDGATATFRHLLRIHRERAQILGADLVFPA